MLGNPFLFIYDNPWSLGFGILTYIPSIHPRVLGNPITLNPFITSCRYSPVGHLQIDSAKEHSASVTLLIVLNAVALPILNRPHIDLKLYKRQTINN